MKKNKIIIILLILFLLVGCMNNEEKKDNKNKNEEPKGETTEEKVERIINDMTIDEKIGQLMIIAYRKPKMDDTLKKELEEIKPGGFILFKENITNYDDTLKFVKEIKSTSKIPMFISTDQEGGRVQRLNALTGDITASTIPNMQKVGNKDDVELTKELGKVMAEELRVFGINLDFAPDADIFSNPDNTVIGNRSFGTTAEIVSKHAIALGNSLKENGVITVYKHFPGHGDTVTDSHIDLPVVNKTKEELMELELKPFIEVINNNADIIMLAHLAIPSLNGGNNTPVTFSSVVINDFLKGELGYKGLVITDALNMKALTNYYNEEDICPNAILAGVDMLLYPNDNLTCFNSLKKAVEDGTISEERINESLRKILTLKVNNIYDNDEEYLDSSYLNSEKHQEVINSFN